MRLVESGRAGHNCASGKIRVTQAFDGQSIDGRHDWTNLTGAIRPWSARKESIDSMDSPKETELEARLAAADEGT